MRRLFLVAALTAAALAVSVEGASACHWRSRQCYSPPCVYYPPPCVYCQPCDTPILVGSESGQPSENNSQSSETNPLKLEKLPPPLPPLKPLPADLK